MLYPENIEEKIGFDQIRHLLSDKCLSAMGRDMVDRIRFSVDFQGIQKKLNQSHELKQLISSESGFPSQNYIDIRPLTAKLNIEGYFLEEAEFYDLKSVLVTIQQIFFYFKNKTQENYLELQKIYSEALPYARHTGWEDLLKLLDQTFDDKGKVRDSASTELYTIRKKLAAELREVQRTIERIFRTAKNSGWIADDMSLTVRDGRLVLPILAEHKRKLQGYVHDETSTGQVAFVEPGEVLEANNEIRDLEMRERKEIIKILTDLTEKIRPEKGELDKSIRFLGLVDFLRAKALLAQEIGAILPQIFNETRLKWIAAKHPLLYLSHKKQKREVVPLQIQMDSHKTVLLISGPNAGGKSVLLKTVCLLQYMIQCGLLVPMSPDSEVGIFKTICIDIGDEQSIENDLSTYSSHLTAMREFLKVLGPESLFLIDEFGSGTEPNVGGAIAEAILEEFVNSGAKGVINTHYTNLKVFADKNSKMQNCAMLFDATHLQPLFQLVQGQPGSSYAFEVAQKIGLNQSLILQAKAKMSGQQLNFENLLTELESEKRAYQVQNETLTKESRELKAKIDQYNSLKNFLDQEQKTILNTAKEQAKGLLKQTNKTIEKTIKEIRESEAQKEVNKKARVVLEKFETEKLKPQELKPVPSYIEVINEAIKKGDLVRIIGQTTIGQVTAILGNEAEISIGELKSKLKLNRLEKISKKVAKDLAKEPIKPKLGGVDLNDKMTNFSINLDIRGKRGEDALIAVNQMLDDAIILGYPQFRILHGKGDGILRNLVRNHLKTYKQVRKIADEHPDRGGQGVSIVDMF
jgi:DNA mismatch repair protein MutS2